jgi:hypothetical protein
MVYKNKIPVARISRIWPNVIKYFAMFAKYLVSEGVRGQVLTSVAQALNELDKLEGDAFSILIVAEGPPVPDSDITWSGKSLHFAGGKNDQYVCTAYVKSERVPTFARNPTVPYSTNCHAWIKRGQLESVYSHDIFGRDLARVALRAFITRGKLTDKLIWEHQPLDIELWKPGLPEGKVVEKVNKTRKHNGRKRS